MSAATGFDISIDIVSGATIPSALLSSTAFSVSLFSLESVSHTLVE